MSFDFGALLDPGGDPAVPPVIRSGVRRWFSSQAQAICKICASP